MDLSGLARDIDSKGSTSNCSMSSTCAWERSVVAILRPGSRGLDCGSFRFSLASALTIGSIVGLLVGCSEDQLAQHWLDS